jgi:hypothetical protein
MMFEVRITYKDSKLVNEGTEEERLEPVHVNVHLPDTHMGAFFEALENKKTYWVEDKKGAFWTNPDMLRFVQAFPIPENNDESKTDEQDQKLAKCNSDEC